MRRSLAFPPVFTSHKLPEIERPKYAQMTPRFMTTS